MKQRARQEPVDPLAFANVYVGLGDKDAAMEWLRKATESIGVDLPWMNVDVQWDPLRSDPRFTVLLKNIGLERSR